MEYPKLRPLEAIPAEKGTVCLRDPMGLSDKLVFLPVETYYLVSLFDGEHSILDIQAAYTRRFGDLLFSDKVKDLVAKLDECLFLESDRFREAKRRALDEFRGAPVRAATHAGSAYEAERDALLSELGGFFEGPGRDPGRDRGPAPVCAPDAEGSGIRGIVAPHIDPRRGGESYAASYAELARRSSARTFVVLGISHVSTARRFVLTDKDFDTPLGPVPADRDFMRRLTGGFRTDFYEDELVHRSEHSVEFQALFLRYVYSDRDDVRIVPVLCSSRDEVSTGIPPSRDPEFREFVDALGSTLSEWGDRACVIAGVDLSHLGRRFGQDIDVTDSFLRRAEADDMDMIRHILNRDAEGFFGFIHAEGDSRNVCGVPALYALLTVAGGGAARLLEYGQAVDRAAQSVVTFMGADLYA